MVRRGDVVGSFEQVSYEASLYPWLETCRRISFTCPSGRTE